MPHHHHHKKRNYEWIAICGVLAVAAIFRLNQLFTSPQLLTAHEATGALVLAGLSLLSVFGLILLAREMFNWEIAAFSGFFISISYLHVMASRISLTSVLAPLLAIWAFYFFWKGVRTLQLGNFAVSGVLWGIGFYYSDSFIFMPIVLALILISHWHIYKNDFGNKKFEHVKTQLSRGFAAIMVFAIMVLIPLGLRVYSQMPNPIKSLSDSLYFDSRMFPIAVFLFLLIGFLRAVKKFKVTHQLLLSWLVVGFLPLIFMSKFSDNALYAILLVPPAAILAGEGLWWIFDFTRKWYFIHDQHEFVLERTPNVSAIGGGELHIAESNVVAVSVTIIFLITLTLHEFYAFFAL